MENKTKDKKLYNIDFLRFIFTIAILLGHALVIHHSGQTIANKYIANSGICVEFFFIIVGLFLHKDIEKKNLTFKNFFVKKIFRLAPMFLFVCILHILTYEIGLIKQRFHFRNEILNMLFIRDIGINSFGLIPLENNLWATNTHAWYLGPLFYISMFYFYILKNFDKKKVHFTMILMIYLSFVFYFRSIFGVFNSIYRAIHSIGIGYFLGIFIEWYKNNKYCNSKNKSKIIYTIIELVCCIELFRTIFKHIYGIDLNIYFIIILCILIFCFVFQKGYIGKLLNIKYIGGFMGKYCYSIYMVQWVIQNIIGNGNKLMIWSVYSNFRANYPNIELIFSLLIIILFGILTYYLVEEPSYNYLTDKFLINKKNKNE